MQDMFEVGGHRVPPHTAMGNKVALTSSWALINLLFGWDNDTNTQAVVGAWQKKTYRLIFRQTYEMILANLGLEAAKEWRHSFLTIVLLTHWILPYATATAFLPLTKVNKNKGLQGRMTWFSTVLRKPIVQNLRDITRVIQRGSGKSGNGSGDDQWLAMDLILAYEFQELIFDIDSKFKSNFSYFQLGF